MKVPDVRKLSRRFRNLLLPDVRKLLRSKLHEERLLAVFILVIQFEKGEERVRKRIYDFYLKHTRRVNNWDLVDASADHIVGGYLEDRNRGVLLTLAGSTSLWERRIAVIATYHFIKRDDFVWTLKAAERLLGDSEDLIHKAVGWILREVGNRDRKVEEEFLEGRYRRMPRTMLRYAIEKFPERRRQAYLQGKI